MLLQHRFDYDYARHDLYTLNLLKNSIYQFDLWRFQSCYLTETHKTVELKLAITFNQAFCLYIWFHFAYFASLILNINQHRLHFVYTMNIIEINRTHF